MNINFPIVYVPEDLAWLNKTYLNNSKKSYLAISEEVYKKPFLKLHVEKLFSRYIKTGNVETMLNALGWKGFRDRLSSSYLYHYYHGFFPNEDEMENIQDIVKFEEELKSIFPEGNSRVFFLGFFLKMCEITQEKRIPGSYKSYLKLSKRIKEALLLGEQKITKPDWLVLTLLQLESYLGDNLVPILKETSGDFKKIRKKLDETQVEAMIKNFLRYGAAINEDEMFIFDKV